MMRNKFLFLVLLGFVMLSSCSDDDKDPFKNYSADYSGDKLALKMNGKEFAGASVAFNSLNEKNASVTLKGMVPGEPALEIKNLAVVDLGNKDFSFVGEDKNDDRTIGVEGTVKAGALSMNTMFKVTSKVVGKWMLQPMEEDADDYSKSKYSLLFNIETDVETIDLPLLVGSNHDIPLNLPVKYDPVMETGFDILVKSLFSSMVPGLLQSIDLKEDGNLIATYMPLNLRPGDEQSQAPLITEEGLVRYNVKDGQIYLLIDVASLIENNTPQANKARNEVMNLDAITQMLSTGIPLKLELTDNMLTAYVDKDMMVPFLPFISMLKDMVVDMEPIDAFIGVITAESLQKFIDDIVNLVSTAKSMELGLILVPYTEEPVESLLSLPRGIERTILKFGK